jgi:hypothetical protein
MEQLTPQEQQISDFIYNYPDVVVGLLNKYGYDISVDTATLPEINQGVFNAIYVDGNISFTNDFDKAISSEGFFNFIMEFFNVAMSAFKAKQDSDLADKMRDTIRTTTLANLSQQEKLANEELKSKSETERTKILANTLLAYRQTLQMESTSRLKGSGVYVLGLAIGLGIILLAYKVTKKY